MIILVTFQDYGVFLFTIYYVMLQRLQTLPVLLFSQPVWRRRGLDSREDNISLEIKFSTLYSERNIIAFIFIIVRSMLEIS